MTLEYQINGAKCKIREPLMNKIREKLYLKK